MGVGHEWGVKTLASHPQLQHHKYTNILGMDDDVGYSILRVTRDQPWERYQPRQRAVQRHPRARLRVGNWVAVHRLQQGLQAARSARPPSCRSASSSQGRTQLVKDYVAFPALTSLSPAATYKSTLAANIVANVIRNIWANAVIFCGHFPDGAEKFTKTDMVGETRGQWYLRQMLGSANFDAGPAMRFMSGNLCYQIEHHLYPDLPSNRLHEISVRVRQVCDKFDLPYTTGSFLVQYGKTWRTIAKLSLPDRYLRDTADDARRPAASGCSPN